MVTIIERQEEYKCFLEEWNNHPSIVIPIWEDLEKHPQDNSISFLYISIQRDWVIPINHNDCDNGIFELGISKQPKWIWDKKMFLQSDIKINNLYDIQTYKYFQYDELVDFNPQDQAFIATYHKRNICDGLGRIAPIMKWIEWLDSFVAQVRPGLKFKEDWVDKVVIPTLAEVERYGICVDEDKFNKRFPNLDRFIKNGRVYTQYNPYIITSRPSNRFGGINFSALNKTDRTREVFIPKRDSIFLQMDFDAYHIRIIGKLIGETLPETSAHQWLAEQYGLPYDEAKSLTFRALYGGIPSELTDIPYFATVREYINKMWSSISKRGEIDLKRRKIALNRMENPNPQKVFNYLLQGLETEINLDKIKRVLDFIKDTDIELNLYTYDAFLFSYPTDANPKYATGIKAILEEGGFPVRVSWGTDYGKV